MAMEILEKGIVKEVSEKFITVQILAPELLFCENCHSKFFCTGSKNVRLIKLKNRWNFNEGDSVLIKTGELNNIFIAFFTFIFPILAFILLYIIFLKFFSPLLAIIFSITGMVFYFLLLMILQNLFFSGVEIIKIDNSRKSNEERQPEK